MTIYLIRHAQTEANAIGLTQGDHDSAITPLGRQQLISLEQQLAAVPFEALFSSPSPRSLATAQALAQQQHLQVQISPLLREKSYGIYEAMPVQQAYDSVWPKQEAANKLPDNQRLEQVIYDQGESDGQAARRLQQFLDQAALINPQTIMAVVSHAAVIRAWLIMIGYVSYQSAPRGFIRNCTYAICQIAAGQVKIEGIHHLEA